MISQKNISYQHNCTITKNINSWSSIEPTLGSAPIRPWLSKHLRKVEMSHFLCITLNTWACTATLFLWNELHVTFTTLYCIKFWWEGNTAYSSLSSTPTRVGKKSWFFKIKKIRFFDLNEIFFIFLYKQVIQDEYK